jgi:autotransporter-associated beta strand protein
MDGPVSGGSSSSIIKSGTGTLALNANNNSFTGSLTINGGGVLVDDLGLGGDLGAGLITINDGGVFTLGATGNADFPDGTDLVINTGGRFELGQGENYGTVTLAGGEFRFFATSRTGVNNSAVAPAAGGMAYDARSGSFTTSFAGGSGGVVGTANVLGHFIKSTADTVTMGDGTSFTTTIPVEVREGTLAFSGTHSVNGAGPLTLGTDTTAGTLRVDAGVMTINRALTTRVGGSTVDVQAAGTLNLVGSISGTGPLALASAGILNFAPAASQFQLVEVALTGNSLIGKADSGTTELRAKSPFSGQLNAKSGVLVLSGEIAGSVVVEDLGNLGGEGVIGGNLDLGQVAGGRLVVDAGTATALKVDGTVNLVGTSLIGLSGMPLGTGSLAVPVLGYGTLMGFSSTALQLENAALYRPGSGVFTDDTAGSRVVMSLETKALVWTGGAGLWDLATNADWQAGGPEKFYYGDAATFDDTSSNATVTLAGDLKPGSITVDSDAANYSLSGTSVDFISGVAGLLKRGSSLLVMDAPNTFVGGAVVEEGGLEIRQLGGAGVGPVALGTPATGSANTAFYLGGQRLNFGRKVTVSGGTGTATLGSRDTVTGSGDNHQFTSISLARDVIFDSNAEDRTDYENITGSGNITVTGVGRSVFPTTPALFVGNVRVSTTGAGSLQVGVASTAGDRIPDASSVTVDAGATLRISTSAETIGSLFGEGTVAGFSPNGGTAVLTIGSGSFSGIIDGNTAGNLVALAKSGTGALVLSGANNYGGTTTVNGGTLQVGDGGAAGDLGFGIVTVAEGAVLSYLRTGSVTQEGRLDSSGTPGGATLTIGGDPTTNVTLAGASGTFSGAVNVNHGTLTLGATNPWASGAAAPAITLAAGTILTNGSTTTHAHLGVLALVGGVTVTTSSGTATYHTENYQLNGNVTVSGGTAAAIITRDASRTNANSGVSLWGTRTFNVADVTGSPAADLVVSTELEPSNDNAGANEGALVKQGAGTLQLAGEIAHSYTGSTVIEAGTLVANGSILGSLTVSAGATLAPGATTGSFGAGATTLNGAYSCEVSGSSADVLNVSGDLILGAASALNLMPVGGGFTEPNYTIATWTGTLTGEFATITGLPANYTVSYDQANKRIQLKVLGNAYATWETAQGIAGAGHLTDSDGDGIPNGVEFVIGGDPSGPNSASNDLLPTATRSGGFLEFVFRRTDASADFAPFVEYGSNLVGWTPAADGINGITIQVDDEHYGVGIDRVTVRIPATLAVAERMFARLGVSIP